MSSFPAFPRRRRRARSFHLLVFLTLVTMLLTPLADQAAMAQADPQQQEQQDQPAEPTEEPPPTQEPVPTEEVIVTEEPIEETMEPIEETVVPTETPTEEPAAESAQLTIAVYRCNHPEFDPYFSENMQRVLDTCTGPGSGTFTVRTPNGEETQSGGSLTFEIEADLTIEETLQPGYDDPIANCFVYDPTGALVDQIGPGETNGGGWRVGGVGGDVHCDWYQVDRGGGEVNVIPFTCPSSAGLSPEPTTMGQLLSLCTEPVAQKQFFVVHGAGLERMGVAGSFGYLFEAIQTGPIEIWMHDPAGFDGARVFCRVTAQKGLVEVSPFTEVSVSDFRASGMTLAHLQQVDCRWFNILEGPGNAQPDPTFPDVIEEAASPTPSDTSSDLVIEMHTCPAGYDPEATGANPETNCPAGPNGVTFTLTDQDPDTSDRQSMTGDATDNAVQFGGIAPGDHLISETVPAGTGTVFVLGCGGGGIDPVPQFIDGTLAITVPEGVILTCPWFNVPADGGGDPATPDASPVASPMAEGTGSIAIVTYNCPAGFDVNAVDGNPRVICPTAANIEFDIDDTIDDDESSGLTTDSGGLGTRDKLPADTYTITQLVPNGVTATFTWDCYDTDTISGRTDPLAMGRIVQVELAEGAALRCDVFNVTGGSGRVVISTHGCGTDVPSYVLALDQLFARCSIDTGAIDFTIVSEDDAYGQTRTAANNPLTLASFDNVPSGYLSIVEKLPGGWGTPIVYCQVLGADGSIVSPPTMMEIVVGRQIGAELEPGQILGCDWFNVSRGNLEVRMHAYTCPEDFDAYRWADAPVTLASNCTGDPGAVEFTVGDGGLYLKTGTATAGAPATWLDVPSGELTITETVPAGYGRPLVLCGIYITDGNTQYAKQAMVEIGLGPMATISQHAPADQLLQCSWFNVKGDTGYIALTTQACPETIDVATASRIQLEQGCNEPIGSVDYTLTSGSFTESATSTDRFPVTDFLPVPTGDLTVKQTSATDYETAVVYCYSTGQGPISAKERVTVSADRAITRPLEPGQQLSCEWYLGTTPEGTITVTKWTCPEGVESGQDRPYYQEKCTQTQDGVEFTVTGVASSSTQTTATGGTAQWTGIQPGLVTIAEQVPEGYGQPVVFCTAPTIDRAFPATNGTIEHDFDGSSLDCAWYNVPQEKGTVVVHKGVCPEGTTADHDAGWYLDNCDQPHEGVAFTLGHAAGGLQRTTDATGLVEWVDLPLGTFSLQEHIPTGYGDPVVYCTDESDVMLAGPGSTTAPAGYFEGELASGASQLTCSWYNIPAGPNSITIHKYTCPAGYDPHASNANPQEDCDEGPNGVTFSVASAATGIKADTADNGSVSFGELASGTYTVTEEVPEGIASVFVWDCTGQRMGEQRPTPLATGPTLELTLDGGEDITCAWYNVEADEDGAGRLTVYKYTCTTEDYVSDLDCEIDEGGHPVDLAWWNGQAWQVIDAATTDGGGVARFTDLAAGAYWVANGEDAWCHVASDALARNGNSVSVDEGEETVIQVYTCSDEPGDQGKVPKTPLKYPNTGVPPLTDPQRETP